MEKRHKEILSALIERLRPLLSEEPTNQTSENTTLASQNTEDIICTWLMRLLVLRTMETRGLTSKPQHAAPGADWWQLHYHTCVRLAHTLPALFPTAVALAAQDSSSTLLACAELLTGRQPISPGVKAHDLEALFADPDVIGWAYQFYQAKARAEINDKCKHGGKVAARAELIAKTQLFTEDYMVQWLLQNSLGRSYIEACPQSTLPTTWPYFFPLDNPETPTPTPTLEELTLLDPCMGSGHFLRAAFDLFVAMYREQHPEMSLQTIIERVFAHHLFGIDLDPRAAQICALTLLLRAWELLPGSATAPLFTPAIMHLATIPASLSPGSLSRHLQRYPQDSPYQAQLAPLFADLEQFEVLGSLVHPRKALDQAMLLQDASAFLSAETRQTLLNHLTESYVNEIGQGDNAALLLGQQSEHDLSLLSILDRQYAIVATNPPYLDSRDMHETLKAYITTHFPAGKRDLYAAFLLRCLDLCAPRGRLAIVTMQSWMFNRSFAELRSTSEKRKTGPGQTTAFTGLLRETSLEGLAHLGARAFEDIGGEIVQAALFLLLKHPPHAEFRTHAWRLVALKSAAEKRAALLNEAHSKISHLRSHPRQNGFLELVEAPIIYYLSDEFLSLLARSAQLQTIAHVRQGLATADNARFTRCHWEIPVHLLAQYHPNPGQRWFRYARGGSYRKWAGLMWAVVDWEHEGRRIKLGVDARAKPRFRDNAPQFAFRSGLTYTFIASGSFGSRLLERALFDVAGTSLFPKDSTIPLSGLAAITSSRVVSYLLRVLTQDLKFNAGYVASTPLAPTIPWQFFQNLGAACIKIKQTLVERDITEDTFVNTYLKPAEDLQAVLHALEGWNEHVVCTVYQLNQQDRQAVIEETGTPAGWYPLLDGYDTLPKLPPALAEMLPPEFAASLANHARLAPGESELASLKARLQQLYAAGPHSRKVARPATLSASASFQAEGHSPIPAETFLEDLSCKMHLHPLSVYWLLEELRADGQGQCPGEELRLLEDHLSMLVLRLLGHIWPAQTEARQREELHSEHESAGIIPLVPCAGQSTLAERLRASLSQSEETRQCEQRLRVLSGQSLEQWLHTSFFERHISRFKQRPLAWHLVSTPARSDTPGKKKAGKQQSAQPAFSCLLYYHACHRETLSQIRSQYVEPLIHTIRTRLPAASPTGESLAREQISELETFMARLSEIEQQGFDCQELHWSLEAEWAESGQVTPEEKKAFRKREAAWHIDVNDGIRVNLAPLQLAGVLAREVLRPEDARKALSDRARWRSEERHWVRAGKLPCCGWATD